MPTILEEIPVELRLFIKHLRFARSSANLTQKQLAEMTGLTSNYLSRVENEQVTIGIDSMALISQALEIPLYQIFDPLLIKQYSDIPESWKAYKPLIDNTMGIPFERKVIASNFKTLRLSQGYTQDNIVEQAPINKRFLVGFEKGRYGIALDNALKLSRLLMVPLKELLIPSQIKQHIQP